METGGEEYEERGRGCVELLGRVEVNRVIKFIYSKKIKKSKLIIKILPLTMNSLFFNAVAETPLNKTIITKIQEYAKNRYKK